MEICKGDADAVTKSLDKAENNPITVADDTDVAMMLLYHWKTKHGEVIFF